MDEILKANPNITIIHLFGDVDVALCNKNQLKIYPQFNGKAQKMSFTLGYLGLKSIINLQSASLKVGELLYKKNYSSELIQLL